ncbi:hypothetical protein P3T23_005587 [Paraburkholderia sp. GAS448]|uniref:DUF2254 family protein n=1 Tax=Paraburkholderia sp. GAS448 TaxID=3035136 RepID=UPI003D1FDDA5
MDRNRWYSLKSHLRSSLWTVPLIAVAVYAVVKPLTEMMGRWMIREGMLDPKTGFLGLSMTGARSLVGDIVSASLSFLVFTFGSLLVAIQVAGGQYTPRIIATTPGLCLLHQALPGQEATFDASLLTGPPAPVAVRYPRSPISFLAGHVVCTAQCRTTPASDWGPGPIRGNLKNRNSLLRTTRLIISDRFPKLGISCYGLDPALSAHCMSSILCITGLGRLIARRLS